MMVTTLDGIQLVTSERKRDFQEAQTALTSGSGKVSVSSE